MTSFRYKMIRFEHLDLDVPLRHVCRNIKWINGSIDLEYRKGGMDER